MKKVVQQKQVVVAQAKQDCEELLVEIVQDKRVADEQEKQVCTAKRMVRMASMLAALRCQPLSIPQACWRCIAAV